MRTPKQVAADKVQAAKDRVNPRAYKDPDARKSWGAKTAAINRNAQNSARAKRKGKGGNK